jgi:outer membrane murein-binding lipoprotein Lpp
VGRVTGDITPTLVLAVAGILWAAGWALRRVWPGLVAAVVFVRSWNGYTDADGKKVPGVVEAIAGIRSDVGDLRTEVTEIRGDVRAAAEAAGAALHEVRPNGGGSLRDKVDQLAEGQQAMASEVTQLRGALEQHVKDSARAPRRHDDPPEADFSPITHG